MEKFNWQHDTWEVVKTLLTRKDFLVEHQLESYNEFLDKALPSIISQFNPIVLNYDYVSNQLYYKISSSVIIPQKSYNKKYYEWTEFYDDDDLLKSIGEIIKLIEDTSGPVDLGDKLKANLKDEAYMFNEKVKIFIKDNIEVKKIPVNKHRYELELCLGEHSLCSPTIHENNGRQKLMHPNEARLRNFTYSADLYVSVSYKTIMYYGEGLVNVRQSDETKLSKISLGKLPIMLNSKACILSMPSTNNKIDYEECDYDEGGYFIINGSEKVIVGQERVAENKIYIFQNTRQQAKYSYICEIKSVPNKKILTPKNIQVKLTSKEGISGKTIKVSLPHIKMDISLFIMFRVLGVISDKSIMDYILIKVPDDERQKYSQLLRGSLEESSSILTCEDAKEYLCKYVNMMGYNRDQSEKARRMTYLNDILQNDFLPHVGDNPKKKAFFLGLMVKGLLDVYLKKRSFDDRDSYSNKRIDTSGVLCANLFRQYYTKMIKDMKTQINKEYSNGSWRANNNFNDIINNSNIYKIIKCSTLTTGLKYALATGNWGLKSMVNKQGIAQVLSRLTYNSTLSHLRRVNTPMEKTSKLIAPRKLHSTQFMRVCPSETPEGGSVGVVKNLALSNHITIYSDVEPVIDLLRSNNCSFIENLDPIDINTDTPIFVNGDWLAVTPEPNEVVDNLRSLRREGIVNIYISIIWNIEQHTIKIYTDAGRCSRPLYLLKNNEFKITKNDIKNLEQKYISWQNLLLSELHFKNYPVDNQQSVKNKECLIEYLDVEEEDTCMIAITGDKLKNLDAKVMRYSYTHCEIHPSLQTGVLASIIPFSDHNQSPRNTYQSAMGKQAMGIYSTNFRNRMDTLAHVLCYPELPIVNSKMIKFLPSNNLPCGINCIVAIASYSGYNQEDSVIMNQGAIDRGLFHSVFYRTYKDEEKKSQSSGTQVQEKFIVPDSQNTLGMKGNDYSHLNSHGFADENTKVNENDIIIGKITPIKNKNATKDYYRCCSTALRPNESGFIDKVMVSTNGDGYKFVKIRVRSNRRPTIGDKHSSRHGQKGTVGIVYNQENMPFTKDGIVPDIIMNPHAVPSRMTIGQIVECITAKTACSVNAFGDATPFTDKKLDELGDVLETLDFHRHGEEILYCGRSGNQMKVSIYIGPTYYQRLKHMVDDKIHSRATGPNVILTRQPAEGRSRDGGLRFGEMERDCILSHGTAQFLKETLQERSDNYKMHICKQCGLICAVNPKENIYNCKNCMNYSNFSELRVPYAMKLFIQELESMSVAPRLITE